MAKRVTGTTILFLADIPEKDSVKLVEFLECIENEKLHIKALSLKINSLEAEKAVLITRNDELESRLVQLSKNVSDASAVVPSDAVTPGVIEDDISSLVSSGSAFKPIRTQMMIQMGRTNERQGATEALPWSMPKNVATAYGHQYDEKLANNMRTELNAAHEECSLLQEKIVQMGCVNFELECELKDTKEKLEKAEIHARQTGEEIEIARRNCAQQEECQKSLNTEFSAKFSALEREVNDLKEELLLKNEELKAKTIENNKRNEEMKQWQIAIDEMKIVHMEIQMLEKQLNNEKAAAESKKNELQILPEQKGDMSLESCSVESVADGEQSTVTQLRQMATKISDLKNTIDKQTKQLERDKVEKRKFKAVIRQLQADKEALIASSSMKNSGKEQHMISHEEQIIGLQRQRDFMDREMTLLCTLNNSKDVLIQALQAKLECICICPEKPELLDLKSENDRNEGKNDRIEQLQAQIKIISQEKSEALNLLAKNNAELEELQMECDQLQSQLQLSPKPNLNAIFSDASTDQHAQLEFVNGEMEDLSMAKKMAGDAANKSVNIEMETQMERLFEAMQQKNTELQKVLNENEALKIKCVESTAALDLLSGELERRSQEKDAIIEMLQSQHTYLTQTLFLNEKSEKQSTSPPTVSQSTNTDIDPKCVLWNASMVMDEAEDGRIPVTRHCETQTMTDCHISKTTETEQELPSKSSCEVIRDGDSVHELENQEDCQCIDRPSQMHDNLTDDAKQIIILNAELETAVEVLKGEIWTLNEELKGSLVDREDLSEKLCDLSQRHEEEIERARERERDLEEQKDMAEKSQRQAALAENESNRRLVEWQEKSAQMENSRKELENAYAKLSEYYQQLQQAYNVLYARFNTCKVDNNTQTIMNSNTFRASEEFAEKIEYLKNELAQRKTELKRQAVELQHVRDLLKRHLHVALKNVRDFREINLKLLKDVIVESIQTVRAQLHETLKEVHSYTEEVIAKWFKEKEMKDAEVAFAMQQLVNGILRESISQTENLSLSVIVDAVNRKFLERESENTALKNDLLNERNNEVASDMEIQRNVLQKEKESKLKIKELEDLLQVTQFSLTEHVTRCQQLQAKLDLLGSATDQSSAAAAKCDTSGSDSWNCSTPCTICRELKQTEQPAPTPQLQLAILAARLTTKIADNDALFRCNAELAQTNLKLQNEVSELREQMAKYITSVNNVDTAATNQQPKQPSNQSLEQKAMHIEKKEWTPDADFDAKLVSNWKFEDAYQQSSLDQQITDFLMKDEINTRSLRKLEPQEQDKESLKKKLNASRKFEEKNEKMENNAGRLGKCLEASGEYCLKHENGMEEVEDGLEIRQYEDAKHQQKLKKTFEDKKLKVSRIDSEEFLSLKSQNVHMGNSDQESKRLREELHSTKMPYENERVHRKLFQVGFTKRSEEQKKAVKTKLEDEGDWISDSAPEHFQTLLEEQVQDIARGSSVEEGRMKLLQELEEQLQQKEIEMQELEKRNRSLSQQLKSQQRLIEGLEKKLDVTEEYSMTLEEKNVSMEQEITDQKKKYKELMMEKVRLRDEVENEVTAKLHVEIMLLKQENESLIVELAKKQTSLDEEKAKMKTRLVNLEYRAVNREIDLEKSKTKPKHTQEEKIQMERQLDGNGTQMNELQGKNEVDQEFHQQLVEAQRKITELKRKLDQVIEQNGLLKNGEQKLMDALVISNKQLAETESKNERLESEISNLQASLLKAGEMAKKTDHSVKLMQDDPNAMIEIHAKAGTSSASIQSLDNPVTIERYCPVQEKVDELKEEFNEASSDNILVKKIQFSALEKKTPLSAELRTYPVRSSVSTPSPFEISFPELNETESNLSSKSSQKKVSTFDNPSESPLQKTTHYFPQVNEDKLRRRKGGGGGFQGAEKI